jgi:drug/metabolite transporter (DMT)-like permease
MTWFFIAIWAPLLWAFANHIDKHLITKYGTGVGIRGLMTFSALASILVAFVAYFLSPSVWNISNRDIFLLIVSGIIYIFAILNYVKALSHDEATNVTPVFQLIPIFAFIIGSLFFSEYLTLHQMLGGLIIIFGAVIISIDFGSLRFHRQAFMLMVLSSFLFAVYQLMFEAGAGQNFWPAIFCQSIGAFSVGIYFLCKKKYSDDFVAIFKHHSYDIILLSLVVEIVTMGGNLLTSKAILMAPSVSLVLLVEAFQPICVFILGIMFTIFIPTFTKEKLTKRAVLQKAIAISVILIGSYILYF